MIKKKGSVPFFSYSQSTLEARMNNPGKFDLLGGESIGQYIYYNQRTGEYRLSRVFAVDLENGYFINPEQGLTGPTLSDVPPHPGDSVIPRIINGNERIVGQVVRQFNVYYDYSATYQRWADAIPGPVVVNIRRETTTHVFTPKK